jgi:hypothetical protein
MRKNLLFVFLLIGVLCFGFFSVASAQMMSMIGVSQGDIFYYNYRCYFNSSNPNAVLPPPFSWINQTDYFMINITGIPDSSVNFNSNMHGLNGSSALGVCSMNVAAGSASVSGYGGPTQINNFYCMARNVGMMGRMFPSSTNSPTINGTFMMNYAGGQRLTNHYNTTSTQNGATVNSDYYFDQVTGMMVQWREETIQTSGGNLQSNSTQYLTMTSSSVWTIPEFPSSAIALTLGGLALFSITIVLVKRKITLKAPKTL